MCYECIINPRNGNFSFGVVPGIKVRGLACEQAEIYLFQGKHWFRNRGFGKRHIWAAHKKEMEIAGFCDEEKVGHFVESIVRSGTELYFTGRPTNNPRILAIRSGSGTAVLELIDDPRCWSIVTAYPKKRKHGTCVGTVL